MAIHLSSPHDVIILLLGVKDSKGILRFPSKNTFNPGIVFKAERNIPVNVQLIKEAEKITGFSNLNLALEIEQNFRGDVQLPNQSFSSLYVGMVVDSEAQAKPSWKSLPEILREMPKHKNRTIYLKAWQVLMGGLTQDNKVLEAEDADQALKDHYANLEASGKSSRKDGDLN